MGRRNMPEDIATFLRHVPKANVRPELVFMYLRALKAINPCWASSLINDSLENRAAMNAIPGQVFASRIVIDDPSIMALDRIAYDNPAQAVDTANIPALPVVLDDQHTNTVSFDHVFLNPRDGDESIAIAGPLSCQQPMVEAIRNLGHGMEMTQPSAQLSSTHHGRHWMRLVWDSYNHRPSDLLITHCIKKTPFTRWLEKH
jgi:hypothetical protein